MSQAQQAHQPNETVDAHVEKRYEILQLLGKGAYGIVWRAVDRKTKKLVALKKIFDAFSNQTDSQRTYREVMFLQRLEHDNIVKLLNVIKAESRLDLYLVFELMETDLYATIRAGILQDVHKQFITYQLLRCIRYLHHAEIIHRDLKPANVLLNSDCLAKLADFGLARSLVTLGSEQEKRPVLTDYVATRWYRPPEIVLGSVCYTKGIDLWGIGCLIAEMLTGKPLFPGTSTMNQLERIIAGIGMPSDKDVESMQSKFADTMVANLPKITPKPLRSTLAAHPPDAVDLISRLLVFNPNKRLTAGEALRHPYVFPFCSAADIEDSPPHTPITVPLPDFTRFEVDQYRDAVYKDIARKRREVRKKKASKKATKTTTKRRDGEGDRGAGGPGDQYEDEPFEEED